ncbi:DUF5007 domain-containing protein [Chitinophaga sp. GCM10012297]|uniref:DUF5007 domain-containing protein n=1 Tax=Chitinophaga chungangae TaxID=2821488 RepID=A0ABS3YG63_9BACT|nr:DUF5007 domain-containing protein [Chitinophaga chungangae]MBO9153676.1 DUF5007 domain-containing protein [Chitinophaga chungangae]
MTQKNIAIKSALCLALLGGVLYGCRKVELQDGYIADTIRYKDKIITLETGRDIMKGDLILDRTTGPVTVELVDIHTKDGKPAPEMLQEVDAVEWKEEFTGQEKSLEELEAKKQIVKRPVFEINKSDGRLIFRKESYDMEAGVYMIDVKVTNGAGSRILKDAVEVNVVKGKDFEYRNDYAWIVCADYDWDNCAPYFDSVNITIESFKYMGPGSMMTWKFKDPNGNLMDPSKFPEGSKQKGKRLEDFVFAYRKFSDRLEYDCAFPFNAGSSPREFEWWVPGSSFGRNDRYDMFSAVFFQIFRPGKWEIVWRVQLLNQ